MKKFILCAWAVLMFGGQIAFGQTDKTFIPFYLTPFNNISIPVLLNEKDTLHLMLHTAANFVTLTEDAVKKIKSISFNGSLEGIRSWGGADNTARVSENNNLQIGGIKFEGVSISENKYSGQQTDGKFGLDLFAGKVIQFDFEQKVITVASSLPRGIKKYQKLKLNFADDLMFVEANAKVGDSVLSNQFLIHSGYSGGILLDDQFVTAHHLGEKLKIVGEKELKDSYGNVLKTKKAILPSLEIGQQKLANVPVGFFEGAIGRQKMSVLGGDVLKRFNIVIDGKREFIYLKANKLRKEKYTNM